MAHFAQGWRALGLAPFLSPPNCVGELILMGKKRLCKVHQREKLEEAERKLMDSWLCFFYDDVFCPYSKIPKEKRIGSVCLRCEHYARWEREMEEEDERVMNEIDEIRRTGVWK